MAFIPPALEMEEAGGFTPPPLDSAETTFTPPPVESAEVEPVGTMRGLATSVQAGFKRVAGLPDTLLLAGTRDAAKPTVRQERRAYVQAMSDPRYMQAAMEDPARAESMFGPAAKLDDITRPALLMQQFTAEDVAARENEIAALPRSEAQQDLSRAQNTGEKWKAWLRNPVELTASIALESLPPSILGGIAGTAIAGPGVGTAIGAGASSGLMTFSSELLGEAVAQGYDVKDATQLQAFLNDSKAFDQALNVATIKSGIIGPVDAATAGQAGRFIAPALREGLKRTLVASGKELGMQVTGGAGGEFAAQLASGQPLDTFDIAMEGIAEIGSAPVEIASNMRDSVRRERNAHTETLKASTDAFNNRPAKPAVFSQFGGEAVDNHPSSIIHHPLSGEVATAPAAVTTEKGITPPPSGGTPAPAQADPVETSNNPPIQQSTVPESPATLHGQIVKLREGKAPAVLFTPEDTVPDWALKDERFDVVDTRDGKVLYDTAAWTKDQITQLVDAGQTGTVLGYGTPSKPAQPTGAIVVRDKQGLELRAVVVDDATAPAALKAAQAYAGPEDVVKFETPEEVLSKRLEATTPVETEKQRMARESVEAMAALAAARKAAEQQAEAAKPVTLPEDKVVKMEAIDRKSGEIVEREMPAAKAGKWLEGRMDILRKLLDCLGKV